jgi:hypothetical protein
MARRLFVHDSILGRACADGVRALCPKKRCSLPAKWKAVFLGGKRAVGPPWFLMHAGGDAVAAIGPDGRGATTKSTQKDDGGEAGK